MADNVAITAGSGTTISTEDVTTLNGGAVAAQHVQRMLAAIRTADGTAIDLPGDASNGLDVDVTRLPALAAGSNNIGRVDVASLPALPSGTNNIGDVDVLSVPADPFGANADAAVAAGAAGSIQAKLRRTTQALEDLKSAIVLATGSNEIGGVNATRIAGTTVDVNAGRVSAGTQRVVIATDQPQLTNAWRVDGSGVTQPVSGNVGMAPQTRGGLSLTRFIDLDEADQAVKASAGQLYGWLITNHAATSRFIKFYNDTTTNITVGTSTPVMTFELPAGAASHIEFANGIAFSAAITVAATTGVADADRGAPAANDVVANFFYA